MNRIPGMSFFPSAEALEFKWAAIPYAPHTPMMWPIMPDMPVTCQTENHDPENAPPAAALEIYWNPQLGQIYQSWNACAECHEAMRTLYAAGEAEEKTEKEH